MRRMMNRLWLWLRFCLFLAMVGTVTVVGLNQYVKATAADRILTMEEAANLADVDCIMVLGCRVYEDGRPSGMLQDRLTVGCTLYHMGAAPKLLMSGDHGRKDYDEVNAMKRYAMNDGIVSSDVFMDHAGFSTYESVYRATDIFEAEKIIIVTQKYHLYRALYIADRLGLEAYGVASDLHAYPSQPRQNIREALARCKDVFFAETKQIPKYLGEAIPISGNGDATNDQQ